MTKDQLAYCKSRMLPESFYKTYLNKKFVFVLDYDKKITKYTLMVYRWMIRVGSTRNFSGLDKPYEDSLGEQYYKIVDTSLYLECYYNKPQFIPEIKHHNFCVLI